MFLFSDGDLSYLDNKYVFLDNDVLGLIFSNEEILKSVLETFSKRARFIIDPLIEFEFLREVFLPTQRILKEQFISNEEIFSPADFNHVTIKKIKENALTLSKIYAHKLAGKGRAAPSTIDLFLAGRVMLNSNNFLIFTGNKKDYPSLVFDTKTVLAYEENDGSLRSFCVLKFNKDKFINCRNSLSTLENKQRKISTR